ncbi:hypothetical protein JOS77_04390 [Chromobacterium haemolyticum]|nr:hypothetical protein JOS77_04390 [Chromobacterium haemolyticum]
MSLDSLMAAGQGIAQQGLDLAGQALDNLAGFAGLNGAPTPAWRLTLNGKPLDSALRRRLVALTLTDNRGFEADQLDIVLDDSDGMLELPGRGAVIAVALGWQHSGLIDKGSYTVDEVEHSGTPDILTLRARSTDLREGIAAKREKSWSKTTLGAIVRAIAAANQLQPAIPDWLAKRRVEQLDQRNESDAQLLHRLAREHDAVATVKNGRLVFCKAGDAETVSGKPFPVCTITRASGDGHRFNIADRNAYTAVKAQWQDLNRAKRGEIIVEKKTPASNAAPPSPNWDARPSARSSPPSSKKAWSRAPATSKCCATSTPAKPARCRGRKQPGKSCSAAPPSSASTWPTAGRSCSPNYRPGSRASSPPSTPPTG